MKLKNQQDRDTQSSNDKNNDINQDIDRVLDFWFGEIRDELPVEPRLKLWFGGGQRLDEDIKQKFEPLVLSAAAGELSAWATSARGTLALIVLLDQFPLNIYRKTARAFAFEPMAIEICKIGLKQGFDKTLSLSERSFFYLPLEHSENPDDQNQSLRFFQQLHEDAPERHREFTKKTLDYAIDHHNTILKFDRYPYRNAVLGRESTAEELLYLADNSSRYGQ